MFTKPARAAIVIFALLGMTQIAFAESNVAPVDRDKAESKFNGSIEENSLKENNKHSDQSAAEGRAPITTPPLNGEASGLHWLLGHPQGSGSFEHFMAAAHPDFNFRARETGSDLLELVGDHEQVKLEGRVCGMRCSRIPMRFVASEVRGDAGKVLISKGPKVVVSDVACACRLFEQPPRDFTNDAQAIRDFVGNGGYLIMTGRDLVSVGQIFPGTIVAAPGPQDHDHLFDAELVRPDPVLADNLVTNALWYLPAGYPIMQVINPRMVRVLAGSQTLAREAPFGSGVLAAVFAYGRGYVLCLAGTLDNNRGMLFPTARKQIWYPLIGHEIPDAAPVIHIAMRQALATNFIEAGLTKRPIPIAQLP